MRVLFALHRVGPYHHARFEAAARRMELTVLETRPSSREYPWSFEPRGDYSVHRLEGAPDPEADPPAASTDRQVGLLLDGTRPEAVGTAGWADSAYHRLLIACHRRSIPLIVASDSRERDEVRAWPKEVVKQMLLRSRAAALVAGSESRAYLLHLGFPADAIFQPWDVVDNDFFRREAAKHEAADPYFLCVSRFVAKKNHAGLLAAYAVYQEQGGAWGLHLVGSGPEEPDIRARIARLPDPARTRVEPFRQLDDLPACYGKASAFILASSTDQWGLVVNEAMAAGLPVLVSSACGCAADLVEPGVSGWTFDWPDTAALAALLHRAERQVPSARVAMVAASRARLEAFGLSAFAEALFGAAQWARAHTRRSVLGWGAARVLSGR